MSLQAPNRVDAVRTAMQQHPEINTLDEAQRGRILDYVCAALGPSIWGRKSRNAQGTDLNTDGLTFKRSDGLFEIYDVISGANGGATWDGSGPYKQGENGYWVPGLPADGPIPQPEPAPQPVPSVDLSAVLAAIAELRALLAADDGRLHDLDERVHVIENRPVTLPKLRVKGSTSKDVYHNHRIDLEVVPE